MAKRVRCFLGWHCRRKERRDDGATYCATDEFGSGHPDYWNAWGMGLSRDVRFDGD